MQYFLNFLIFALLLAVTVWPICASIRNGLLSRRATFAGRTAEQWRADRTPHLRDWDFLEPGAMVEFLPGEEPPPWPHQGVTIDPASIYERWNDTTGKTRTVGKHPGLGMPYKRAPAEDHLVIVQDDHCSPPRLEARKACPHCDESHEPGKCQFRIAGINTDPGQLGGD